MNEARARNIKTLTDYAKHIGTNQYLIVSVRDNAKQAMETAAEDIKAMDERISELEALVSTLTQERDERQAKVESLEVDKRLIQISNDQRRRERAKDTQFLMALLGVHGLMDDTVIRLDDTFAWVELVGNAIAKARDDERIDASFNEVREAIRNQMHRDIADIMTAKESRRP